MIIMIIIIIIIIVMLLTDQQGRRKDERKDGPREAERIDRHYRRFGCVKRRKVEVAMLFSRRRLN